MVERRIIGTRADLDAYFISLATVPLAGFTTRVWRWIRWVARG